MGDASSKTNTQAIASQVLSICAEKRLCWIYFTILQETWLELQFRTTQTQNVVDFYKNMQSTSFGVFDNGWKYVYDRFADKYRYVPLNGDVAGLCASVTANGTPWFSPAGLNRGAIRGAVKLVYSPTKSERDTLYQKRINPVTSFIWVKESSFRRQNCSRFTICI